VPTISHNTTTIHFNHFYIISTNLFNNPQQRLISDYRTTPFHTINLLSPSTICRQAKPTLPTFSQNTTSSTSIIFLKTSAFSFQSSTTYFINSYQPSIPRCILWMRCNLRCALWMINSLWMRCTSWMIYSLRI
jgi:hypothetical protein